MPAGASKTYNLAQCVFTINGVPLEGFGSDDAVVIAPNDDLWTTQTGADGEETRSATNTRSGQATITLMSTSNTNDLLNTFLQLIKSIAIGDRFVMFIRDLNSGDQVIAEQAYIQREPDMSFGKEASTREWTIYLPKYTSTHGGAIR